MKYYIKGLDPDNKLLVASGTQIKRTVHAYPEHKISTLEDWETIMRDDGESGLSFVDEYDTPLPASALLAYIDASEKVYIQTQLQPVV